LKTQVSQWKEPIEWTKALEEEEEEAKKEVEQKKKKEAELARRAKEAREAARGTRINKEINSSIFLRK